MNVCEDGGVRVTCKCGWSEFKPYGGDDPRTEHEISRAHIESFPSDDPAVTRAYVASASN